MPDLKWPIPKEVSDLHWSSGQGWVLGEKIRVGDHVRGFGRVADIEEAGEMDHEQEEVECFYLYRPDHSCELIRGNDKFYVKRPL